jgi:hypothetical protein
VGLQLVREIVQVAIRSWLWAHLKQYMKIKYFLRA